MTKAPHRPVTQPVGGGASFRRQPRASNGQFVKYDDVAAASSPSAPDKPAPRKRAPTPEQLVARVTRAIERELAQIEDIVAPTGKSTRGHAEAEKRARMLASLARTLAEVTRLRSAANEAKHDHDDDAVPRDLDEFRRTLERRLAQLVDPPEVVPDRGDDAA